MSGAIGASECRSYKVILAGDATVGKTHLVSRYTRNTLPKAPAATIGLEFATQVVKLQDGQEAKAMIWDTAGQERYRAVVRSHYSRAAGAVLVYDITKRNSFVNAAKWLEEVRMNSDPDTVVMLMGNKYDLVESDSALREIPYEMAAQYAQKNSLMFFEVSAVSTHNVKLAFDSLVQEIHNVRSRSREVDSNNTIGGGIGLGNNSQFVNTYCKGSELPGGLKLDDNPQEERDQNCC